jgi:SAM-dependent methyltransferase
MDDVSTLVRRARELAPWHFDYEIAPGVNTASLNEEKSNDRDKRGVSVIDPSEMKRFFKKYYPNGLAGKELIDVGCNSGAYCFIAADLGAQRVTGFDVRQHWIDQAEFIRQLKYPRARNIHFNVKDVNKFVEASVKTDITIFKGVLYHLADPIHVVLGLAERTREVILIDTESSNDIPEGAWVPIRESVTHVMSGVEGLAWRPGGPAAIQPLLEHVGFRRFQVPYWRREHRGGRPGDGRFRIIGAR